MVFDFLSSQKDTIRSQLKQDLVYEVAEKGSSIVPIICELLRDPEKDIRLNAAKVAILLPDADLVSPLISASHDPDNYIRMAASKALATIGNKRAVMALVENLQSDNPGISKPAMEVLSELRNEEAVDALTSGIKNDDPFVRAACVKTLGNISTRSSLVALVSALNDANSVVRTESAKSIGHIHSEKAMKYLVAKLDDPIDDVKEAVIDAITAIGGQYALPAFVKGLDSNHTYVRIASVEGLSNSNDPRVMPYLKKTLDDKNTFVRKVAIEAIIKMDQGNAVEILKSIADDPDAEIRKLAQSYSNFSSKFAQPFSSKNYVVVDNSHGESRQVLTRLDAFKQISESLDFTYVEMDEFNMSKLNTNSVFIVILPRKPFSPEEIKQLYDFVAEGGTLILLGSWGREFGLQYLNEIVAPLGIFFNKDLVCDFLRTEKGYRVTFAEAVHVLSSHPLFSGVKHLDVYKSCSLTPGKGKAIAFGSKYSFADENMNMHPDGDEKKGYIPVMVFLPYKKGAILCAGDYHIFSESAMSHKNFIKNILQYDGSRNLVFGDK